MIPANVTKKSKIIVSLSLLVFMLSAFSFAADIIVMKDGQKYGGVIIEYRDGKYILKARGKKYTIYEKEISSISWNSTQAELDSALANEKITVKGREKLSWGYIQADSGYLMMLAPDITSSMGKGMMLYGGGIGYKEKLFGAGFEALYGSMSGNLTYTEPGAPASSNTKINTSTLFLTLKLDYRDHIDGFFCVPVLNVDLGATINFDTLDNYPLGWSAYKDDPAWMLSPGMAGAPGKVSATYLGFTGSVVAGLDFPLGDSFSAYIKAGFTGLTKNTYGDLFKYGTSIGFLPGDATKFGYGLLFQAGAKVLY